MLRYSLIGVDSSITSILPRLQLTSRNHLLAVFCAPCCPAAIPLYFDRIERSQVSHTCNCTTGVNHYCATRDSSSVMATCQTAYCRNPTDPSQVCYPTMRLAPAILTLILSGSRLSAAGGQTCYFPAGNVAPTNRPCFPNNDVSPCCDLTIGGDFCLSDGYCYSRL